MRSPVARPGGEHQDRHAVALAAQHATDGESVDHGHRHVEQDGVDGVVGQPAEHLGAVLDGDDLVALQGQGPLQRLPHGAIVLGDEQLHATSTPDPGKG